MAQSLVRQFAPRLREPSLDRDTVDGADSRTTQEGCSYNRRDSAGPVFAGGDLRASFRTSWRDGNEQMLGLAR
jgi:hypothetical protein